MERTSDDEKPDPNAPTDSQLIHASAIAIDGGAVLIRGSSGAGKSDLVLRCLALAPTSFLPLTARLVSDDQAIITREGPVLTAAAPKTLFGKLEVRGVGILNVEADTAATVMLICDITQKPDIERFPDPPQMARLLGIDVPVMQVAAYESSAHIKIMAALTQRVRDNAPL